MLMTTHLPLPLVGKPPALDPRVWGQHRAPCPPSVSLPYLFVTDTFPHLPPFLLYRGHYNSFGGHAYYGILWEVAHISLLLLLLYVSITGAVQGL
jgi:hypothetical protein